MEYYFITVIKHNSRPGTVPVFLYGMTRYCMYLSTVPLGTNLPHGSDVIAPGSAVKQGSSFGIERLVTSGKHALPHGQSL